MLNESTRAAITNTLHYKERGLDSAIFDRDEYERGLTQVNAEIATIENEIRELRESLA